MAFRSDIPDSARGFFYATSGDDALSGTTIELAKESIQSAIDEAALLVPTPDFNNTAAVSPAQPGSYTESITLTDGLFFNAESISLIATDTVTVKSANATGVQHGIVGNDQISSSVFEIDGSSLFAIQSRVVVNDGDSSIIYDVTGTVDDIFIEVGLTQVAGDGAVGLSFTGVADSPLVWSGARIDLIGANCTAVLWNPSGASAEGVCNVGAIETTAINQILGISQTGSSTTAFDIRGGVYSANMTSIDSDILCDIDSGAVLNIICPDSSGDITVNSGGTLNCVLSNHTGTITNNGTINGTINGVRFGNWVVSASPEVTVSFDANNAIYPASNPAAASSRNGHPIAAFDDTTAENVVFNSVLSDAYDAGNIEVSVDWVAETATTSGVTWGVEFERNNAGGTDIDSDSFDTQQTGNSTTNGTSGIITRTTITLTQAEADDLAAGDSYRMRVQRVTGDGGDTMTDDAQIISVSVNVNG